MTINFLTTKSWQAKDGTAKTQRIFQTCQVLDTTEEDLIGLYHATPELRKAALAPWLEKYHAKDAEIWFSGKLIGIERSVCVKTF